MAVNNQFGLRDCEREEGKNCTNLISSLISPKFSHQLSVRRGDGIGGGGTYSVLLMCTHLMVSDLNYR